MQTRAPSGLHLSRSEQNMRKAISYTLPLTNKYPLRVHIRKLHLESQSWVFFLAIPSCAGSDDTET